MEKKLDETKEHLDKNRLISMMLLVCFVFGMLIYKFLKGEINYYKLYIESMPAKGDSFKDISLIILSNHQIYIIVICFVGFYFLRKHNREWELKNVYVYNDEEDVEGKNRNEDNKKENELEKIERFADAYQKNNDLFSDNNIKKMN